MQIVVNGTVQSHDREGSLTIAELLTLNRVETPETVSVQLNGQFVAPERLAAISVQEGDTVDFLYFLGGGAR